MLQSSRKGQARHPIMWHLAFRMAGFSKARKDHSAVWVSAQQASCRGVLSETMERDWRSLLQLCGQSGHPSSDRQTDRQDSHYQTETNSQETHHQTDRQDKVVIILERRREGGKEAGRGAGREGEYPSIISTRTKRMLFKHKILKAIRKSLLILRADPNPSGL